MKLDIRGENVVYIEIGEWTFYIDNSTNEQIVSKWKTKQSEHFDANWEAVEE